MVMVAHPDDETFGCGSLLLHAAEAGAVTAVCCATRGELGEVRPGVDTSDGLAVVRERELRDAAALLRVGELTLLDFGDSGMSGDPPDGALVSADLADVAAAVQAELERFRPHIVVTLEGGDGHRDHLHIRDATLVAIDNMQWQVERVYLYCLPQSLLREWIDYMSRENPDAFEHLKLGIPGTPDENVTTVIDTATYLPMRDRAIAAHATQTSPFDALPDELRRKFLSKEHLQRIRPPWTGGPIETDVLPTN